MDYEKEYKKKLDDARYWYNVSEGDIPAVLEEIFPELRESEDERIRKELIEHIKANCETGFVLFQKFSPDDVIAWLEKQGEQKFADKVEQKFHEGDWIISNNKKYIYQVVEVKRGIYVVRDNADNHEYHIGIEECEKSGRLWTIQDAKDDDVLVHNGITFIFKGIEDGIVKGLCSELSDSILNFGEPEHDKDYYPATKEQRDTLFTKMKEAGYEWDAERKELNKIENHSLLSDFFNAEYEKGKADALKCVEWSEEDEGFLNLLLAIFKVEHPNGIFSTGNITVFNGDSVTSNRIIDWIKSLKDRVQPQSHRKPSEEQMKTLHDMNLTGNISYA